MLRMNRQISHMYPIKIINFFQLPVSVSNVNRTHTYTYIWFISDNFVLAPQNQALINTMWRIYDTTNCKSKSPWLLPECLINIKGFPSSYRFGLLEEDLLNEGCFFFSFLKIKLNSSKNIFLRIIHLNNPEERTICLENLGIVFFRIVDHMWYR